MVIWENHTWKEFVDASVPNAMNLARHINHSCSPNAVVQVWESPAGQSRPLVISKRNISPNKEITIHYGRSGHIGILSQRFTFLIFFPAISCLAVSL